MWDIRRAGRAWTGSEATDRFTLTPEKFEMASGQLFWTHEQRMATLALLLENVGIDAAIRLGDPTVWKEAIAALDGASAGGSRIAQP